MRDASTQSYVELRCGRSRFNLAGAAAEEYPTLPEFSPGHLVRLQAAVLSQMIERTMYAASLDETRYNLNGVYFEVITSTIEEGSGDCFTSAGAVPVAIGHIFGRCQFTPGQETYSDEVKRVTFTGVATNNPQLYNGPWNDFPAAGYIPNSPLVKVGYSQDEYDAILADVQCGFVDLPVGS